MSCIFCAIVADQADAVRVYEDDDYLGFLDIRPIVRGHTLVVPKVHTKDLTDTPAETVAGLVTVGQRIAQAARASELAADGNNIVINDGKAAFQTVFHLHLHVAPARTATRCPSPRAWWCAAIQIGRRPAGFCVTRWPGCRFLRPTGPGMRGKVTRISKPLAAHPRR